MTALIVSAPASGSGKTAVTCGLLRAFRRRCWNPCAFKCGPDYIDPMFHRTALGVESHNLDLYLGGAEQVRRLFARSCTGHGAAVCEGVMGYYDGLGGTTDTGSSRALSRTLNLPVLLVIRARGASLSLAALIRGFRDFRSPHEIAAVLLNECSPALCRTLTPVLEEETGIPVIGCLPKLEAASFSSRHLGLYTAPEIADLDRRLDLLADALEENADLERLSRLCAFQPPDTEPEPMPPPTVRIAAARDEAFCFTYAETLETLRAAGAEPVFFSPVHDTALPPDIGGLYLPGGYPELYAGALSENVSMRESVAEAVRGGMPTVAECGGFLYLGASLSDPDGHAFPMAGVLPGAAANAGRLVRFGYAALCPEADSLLFRAGERVPVHEFHYWDSTANGKAFRVEKGGRDWHCGYASSTLYAAFPHLYLAGNPELAARFVRAAEAYQERHHESQ